MVIERAPLEDELGDVLDKAMRGCGMEESQVAEQADIPVERLRSVVDYCEKLTREEIDRVAAVLNLQSIGLHAVASEAYPLPDISGLPGCLYPLRMRHGIGVANSYLVAGCSNEVGILFDTGTGPEGLWRSWPAKISRVTAVFLTHYETEHTGGLAAVRERFRDVAVFGPDDEKRPAGVVALGDGAVVNEAGFSVEVCSTPGHVEAHHCYRITQSCAPQGRPLLISGDLLFAGSIGGAFHCCKRLHSSLDRIVTGSSPDTVVAPGHGPLTTIRNERKFNPFIAPSS